MKTLELTFNFYQTNTLLSQISPADKISKQGFSFCGFFQVNQKIASFLELASSISVSQSTILFLPLKKRNTQQNDIFQISHYASASLINERCPVRMGSGVIGLTAKTKQMAHITDFQHSNKALGFYNDNTIVKSLIALPFLIENETNLVRENNLVQRDCSGILYCDSNQTNYFSEKVISQLTTLTRLLSETLHDHFAEKQTIDLHEELEAFNNKTLQLIKQLGHSAVDLIRIRVRNQEEVENKIGLNNYINLFTQLQSLIKQILTSKDSYLKLSNGETLVSIDNMMSNHFENKIRIIASQLCPDDVCFDLEFIKTQLDEVHKGQDNLLDCFREHQSVEETHERKRLLKALFA